MNDGKTHMIALNTLCSGLMESTSDELKKQLSDIQYPIFVRNNIHSIFEKCTIILTLSDVLKKAVNVDGYFQSREAWAEKYTQAITDMNTIIGYIQSHTRTANSRMYDDPETNTERSEADIKRSEDKRDAYMERLRSYTEQYTTAFQKFLDVYPKKEEGVHAGFEPFKLNTALKHVALHLDNICHQNIP